MAAARGTIGFAVLALAASACRTASTPGAAAAASPPALAIRGTIVRPDGTTLPDGVIVAEGNRIVGVGSWRELGAPPRARVVGGASRFLVPGLIDAHVHFFQSGGSHARPDILDLTAELPYDKERAAVRAGLDDTLRRYLRSGVTSVVDAGGPMWNFEVRAHAARLPLSPRVAVAGPLLSSVSRPQLDAGDPPIVRVVDPGVARALVRVQATLKPDLVKLWWVVPPGGKAADWLPAGQAAIEEAHAHGLRVAVHATELETARTAVQAGADVLVHDVADADVDQPFVDLLKERGTLYVSTLVVNEGYNAVFQRKVRLSPAVMQIANPWLVASVLEPFAVPERFRAPRPLVPPAALRNALRLQRAGVVIAAGSDAGNIGTFHGPALHRELELLVEAGLTPAEALRAATAGSARVMGRAGELGALEPGRLADVLVLEASPLDDLDNLGRLSLVVKDGVPYRPGEILARSAAEVVQAQLNAFNAQDLEALLSTYAEDAVIRRGGQTAMKGREAMREEYGRIFAESPAARARVVERRTEGEGAVLEHQVVTGRGPERPDPWDVGWVRYEVEDGLIRRVALP